jgi:hypothetical protein
MLALTLPANLAGVKFSRRNLLFDWNLWQSDSGQSTWPELAEVTGVFAIWPELGRVVSAGITTNGRIVQHGRASARLPVSTGGSAEASSHWAAQLANLGHADIGRETPNKGREEVSQIADEDGTVDQKADDGYQRA